MITPLTKVEYENYSFYGMNLVRIRTPINNSSIFHALLKAYLPEYILNKIDDVYINRNEYVLNLRKQLSNNLDAIIDPSGDDKTRYYDELMRGKMNDVVKVNTKYEIQNMKDTLIRGYPVSHVYLEYISNQMDKDIYVIDSQTNDVVMLYNDMNTLYKDRDSIIVYNVGGHIELIGWMDNGNIVTLFNYKHDIIQGIRKILKGNV